MADEKDKPGTTPPAPAAAPKGKGKGADAKAGPAKGGGARPDIATILGLLLAMGGIVGGLLIEGGKIKDILQTSAAIIVLGGTIGATLVSTPLDVVLGAVRRLVSVFFSHLVEPQTMIEEVIQYATKARKNGLVSLEGEALEVADPFLKKALNLAVDGTDLQEIRKMMELEMSVFEHRGEAEAKVFESAGGFAPTIGIIGAVLGLIQVMKKLDDMNEVGSGIAVAFVATVYGVASANIFFLPAATKIKSRLHHEMQIQELILEGVIGIVEGLNPKLIRSKLEAFTQGKAEPGKAKDKGKDKGKDKAKAKAATEPAKAGTGAPAQA